MHPKIFLPFLHFYFMFMLRWYGYRERRRERLRERQREGERDREKMNQIKLRLSKNISQAPFDTTLILTSGFIIIIYKFCFSCSTSPTKFNCISSLHFLGYRHAK